MTVPVHGFIDDEFDEMDDDGFYVYGDGHPSEHEEYDARIDTRYSRATMPVTRENEMEDMRHGGDDVSCVGTGCLSTNRSTDRPTDRPTDQPPVPTTGVDPCTHTRAHVPRPPDFCLNSGLALATGNAAAQKSIRADPGRSSLPVEQA